MTHDDVEDERKLASSNWPVVVEKTTGMNTASIPRYTTKSKAILMAGTVGVGLGSQTSDQELGPRENR